MRKRITKAFTLIELLVVIAIIGILTGFIFVSMNGAVNSAKDAKRKADISTISKAIMAYMAQNNNAYPYTATTTACNLCNNDSCTNPCTGFYANIQPYLSNIPLDPNGSTYYTYTYSATPKFVLQSTLSNTATYQYDSTSGFATINYSSTCTAATNSKVSCTTITISSTEEVCKCTYLSGDGATTWTTPYGVTQVQYLVVAGGGGGGHNGGRGGGGGGGGLITGTTSVSTGSQYGITVGAGGIFTVNLRGTNGGNSSFSSFVATGGGGGGGATTAPSINGASGGSGGGGSSYYSGTGGSASPAGQGNVGGAGTNSSYYGAGGGGGAGGIGNDGVGNSGGNGGVGLQSSITGVNTYYAGGGGGGATATGGAGGSGGGGNGYGSVDGTNGTDGLGGGGGGHYYNGGSGVVIFRYTHP